MQYKYHLGNFISFSVHLEVKLSYIITIISI